MCSRAANKGTKEVVENALQQQDPLASNADLLDFHFNCNDFISRSLNCENGEIKHY